MDKSPFFSNNSKVLEATWPAQWREESQREERSRGGRENRSGLPAQPRQSCRPTKPCYTEVSTNCSPCPTTQRAQCPLDDYTVDPGAMLGLGALIPHPMQSKTGT